MDTKDTYFAKNRSYHNIRLGGAIGNLNEGIEIMLHNIPTRLID